MKFDKQAALVSRLFKASNEGKLEWKPSARADAVQVSFPNFTVVLWVNSKSDVVVDVKNDEGETIESFSDPQLRTADLNIAPPGGDTWFQSMLELYRIARRIAKGADQALDDILKEIPE